MSGSSNSGVAELYNEKKIHQDMILFWGGNVILNIIWNFRFKRIYIL